MSNINWSSYAWVSTNDYWYIISRSELEDWQRIECTTDTIQEFLDIPIWDIEGIQDKIREILFNKQLELDLWEKN